MSPSVEHDLANAFYPTPQILQSLIVERHSKQNHGCCLLRLSLSSTMSAKYDTKRVQDNLASYFDRSAAAVRQRLDGYDLSCFSASNVSPVIPITETCCFRIERNYARPAVGYGLASFETHPITSVSSQHHGSVGEFATELGYKTFVAIFSILSFLPVVSFM